jgi:hypothetical protein
LLGHCLANLEGGTTEVAKLIQTHFSRDSVIPAGFRRNFCFEILGWAELWISTSTVEITHVKLFAPYDGLRLSVSLLSSVLDLLGTIWNITLLGSPSINTYHGSIIDEDGEQVVVVNHCLTEVSR